MKFVFLSLPLFSLFLSCGDRSSPSQTFSSTQKDEPGSLLQFVTHNQTNSQSDPSWGPVLKDIMNHATDSNSYDDKVTLAHETTHGINSYLRGHFGNGKKVNGFYVLQGRGVIIEEPNIRKSQVGPFVPQSLRESRYNMYVVGMPDWDDTPLYLFDEWTAYTNGGDAGVDLEQRGLWHYGWRDAVMGQIEFCVYSIATAMAVKQLQPQYFAQNLQFREYVAWNLKRAMTSFKLGAAMPDFKWDTQDTYYTKLKTSADAETLRQFVRDQYGADWTREVMGF